MSEKISVSWDEVSSSQVDDRLKQQDVMQRVQEHQAQVLRNASGPGGPHAPQSPQTTGNLFYKAWAYLALFGLGFGFLAWVMGEGFMQETERLIALAYVQELSNEDIESFRLCNVLWYVINCTVIARTLAWGMIGMFVAIAPGIVMRNRKKFFLGLIGGALGGLLGGLLFDPIGHITQTSFLSRMVGIISFGVLAGLAMGLLEDAAKQGWLRVVAGVIAGKQFILYKNPTVIGSSPKSEIYLFKDTSVMPIHAAIRQQGANFWIENLDANGYTVVNGVPVVQQPLKNGDCINIGSTQFVFGVKEIQNR